MISGVPFCFQFFFVEKNLFDDDNEEEEEEGEEGPDEERQRVLEVLAEGEILFFAANENVDGGQH